MKRFGIALLVILTIQGISFGQSSKLRMADSYFGKLSYAYAAPLYAELIGTPEENTSVKHKLAICHYHMGDMQNAEKYFLEIINSDAVGVDDYFMLSQALKQNGKTKESDLWMGNLNVKYPNDHRGLSYSNNRGYQENIVKNSIHFGISHLSINTPYTEFGAYQIYGKDEVIVISNRGFSNAVKQDWTWNDSPFLDMYVSNQIKKDSLSTPVVKKGKSNTRFHEGPLSFSPDGKKVYFTRNNISEKKMRRDANGIQNLKIYEADVSEKGEWLNEREIALNSKDFSVGHPTLSSDGKTMFFASDMPGGFGAAIQDYKRGIIVGEQSYGKGTVQSVVDLDNYMANEKEPVGQLKITLEKFYRINGSSTQHKGVSPDFAMPSAFSAEEFGESSQPSALPWDMIASTVFTPTLHVNPAVLSKVQSGFNVRLKTKPDLVKLRDDFNRWKKIKETNSISLNLTKRKKELDDQKKKPDEAQAVEDALSGGNGPTTSETEADKKAKSTADKHAKDVYLKETQQIVADWLQALSPKVAKLNAPK